MLFSISEYDKIVNDIIILMAAYEQTDANKLTVKQLRRYEALQKAYETLQPNWMTKP